MRWGKAQFDGYHPLSVLGADGLFTNGNLAEKAAPQNVSDLFCCLVSNLIEPEPS